MEPKYTGVDMMFAVGVGFVTAWACLFVALRFFS